MRLFVLMLLLAANAGYFAWSAGWLRDWGLAPAAQTEPQRLAQQIRPEALRIIGTGNNAGNGPAVATPVDAAPPPPTLITTATTTTTAITTTTTAVRSAPAPVPPQDTAAAAVAAAARAAVSAASLPASGGPGVLGPANAASQPP